jgi:inosine-uridine nucleoside N-ribohydrolase
VAGRPKNVTRTVILDVDPGCDDAVMMAMALGSDAVDVVGVTTVAGNSTLKNTTHSAASILTMAGRSEIPLAKGCHRPLVDSLDLAEWIHGENGIRGDLPVPTVDPVSTPAPEFIIEKSKQYGAELTLVAVGPLTNIAVALAQDPGLRERIGSLVLMGGAAMTAGNATPVAEANFHNDPAAASRVLQDGKPKMVGLDVTNAATVEPDYRERLAERPPPGRTLATWFDYPPEIMSLTEESEGPAIHDAAAVADLIDDVLTYDRFHATVDTSGGPSHGSVICDVNGVTGEAENVAVATEIDVASYRRTLEAGIDGFLDQCRR